MIILLGSQGEPNNRAGSESRLKVLQNIAQNERLKIVINLIGGEAIREALVPEGSSHMSLLVLYSDEHAVICM